MMSMEFDGVIHLAIDADATRISLPPAVDGGGRHVFTCCCDCGLTHVLTVWPNGDVTFVRADNIQAHKIRMAGVGERPLAVPSPGRPWTYWWRRCASRRNATTGAKANEPGSNHDAHGFGDWEFCNSLPCRHAQFALDEAGC